MKVFHCDHCNQLLFFENSKCVACGAGLAFLPDSTTLASFADPFTEPWHPAAEPERPYRLCRNYVDYQTCNWAVAADDDHALCRSCRLTRVIPDVSQSDLRVAWYKAEIAKRRLVFTLMALGLPLLNRDDDPQSGLAFEFMTDPTDPAAPRIMTGHANGVITVNLAEADDAEREKRRQGLSEPYRTLLGHMRHESGHYYWDRLIRDSADLEQFRQLFGDERPDYGGALQRYYAEGPALDWSDRCVSSYASAHAWEDWAETWAHYLHMVDAIETASDNGLVLRPKRADEPAIAKLPRAGAVTAGLVPFERLIDNWFALTYVLNNLNRSLGMADGYPFVLSTPAIEKLQFVHEVVGRNSGGPAAAAAPPSGEAAPRRTEGDQGKNQGS